jgi:hypothetical protein
MGMPILNLPNVTFQQANPGYSGAGAMNDLIAQGIQNQYMGPQLQQKLAQEQLKTQIMQPQAQYAPQMTLAELLKSQAEAPHVQAETQELLQGKIPFERAHAAYESARIDPYASPEGMPELMKAEMFYNHAKNQYGEDHPITKEALNNYRLLQQQATATSTWHQQLAESMGFRALPTAAKAVLNTQQAQGGFQPSALNNVPTGRIDQGTFSASPTGSIDLNRQFGQPMVGGVQQAQQPSASSGIPTLNDLTNPSTQAQVAPQAAARQVAGQDKMSANQVADYMTNALLKSTNTSQNLNKIQFGSQVEKTLANMLPFEPAMEYYTGAAGRARLALDKIKSSTGSTTPEYASYLAYQTHAQTAARQMRQYRGDSIQQEAMKDIDSLTNPAAWDKGPDAVKSSLNSVITNFNSEIEQRRNASQGPSIYKSGQKGVPLLGQMVLPTAQQSSQQIIGGQVPTLGQAAQGQVGKELSIDQKIEYTAKKYGISVDEVKRRMGGK